MSDKKYVVWPGDVISKNDGDRHFISFPKLCELYGVNPEECYDGTDWRELKGIDGIAELINLRPSYSGDYTLPTDPKPGSE